MRGHATLTERRAPWVVFTRHDDPWLNDETAKLQRLGGRVIRMDGRQLRDPRTLFATFARELRFPAYFGHNWDALVDCLQDWHGHGGASRDAAVVIDSADDLLSADFLGCFVSVLCQAAWRANLRLDADGNPDEGTPPFTLHTAFLLNNTPPTAFAGPAATDMDVAVRLDEGRLTATLTGEDWPDVAPGPKATERVSAPHRLGEAETEVKGVVDSLPAELVDRLSAFLENAEPLLSSPGTLPDPFSDSEQMRVRIGIMTDGVWVWQLSWADYVRYHRVAPPAEFLQHIESVDFRAPEIPEGCAMQIAKAEGIPMPPDGEDWG
ncbi:barstar family protein [Streptomyces sp. NPDC055189]